MPNNALLRYNLPAAGKLRESAVVRNHNVRLLLVCILILTIFGCRSADPMMGKIDNGWGPGVLSPDAARQKIVEWLTAEDVPFERGYVHAQAIFCTLTWKQACYVWRTSPQFVRIHLCCTLLHNDRYRFEGMTRQEIVSMLGEPDEIEDGDYWYNGEGYISDSVSGFVFGFGENGRVVGWGSAN